MTLDCRHWTPVLARTVFLLAALSCAGAPRAGLLLTEIHYNGPTPGTDPDEFLELSNDTPTALLLDGYRFATGVDFSFGAGSGLAGGASLVLARDMTGFLTSFPGYQGALFDFAGALSNSGERLQLLDAAGDVVWTVDYDDGGAWPGSADGGGDSLQLRAGGNPVDAADWFAALPDPGRWAGSAGTTPVPMRPVPAPAPLLLLPATLLMLAGRRRRSAVAADNESWCRETAAHRTHGSRPPPGVRETRRAPRRCRGAAG